MRVVAGLGNPGAGYHLTRHNAGFRTVDILAGRAGVTGGGGDASAAAWRTEATLAGQAVLLVKPLAYMNASGPPVAEALRVAGASPAELVVIVDDVALELGRLRVRVRGSHGGHNGLRSLVETLGTEEFVRVRIGVRHGEWPEDLAAYVLAAVPDQEEETFRAALVRAADAVECVLGAGAAMAMNCFNGPGG